MAENVFDVEPEFWLPAEFLTDEDILINNNKENKNNNNFCFPSDFPLNFDQQIELTRQKPSHYNFSGSPKSTLFHLGGSSNGSPNGQSQVTSPTSQFPHGSSSLDLIHQAATQISKLKVNGAGEVPLERSYTALYSSFIQRVREEQILKHQQMRENMYSNQLKNGLVFEQPRQNRFSGTNVGAYLGNDEDAWPSLQYMMQQNLQKRTGVRGVVPIGGSGNVRKPSAGTGVFLPRRYENNCVQNKTYKKTGCSTTSFHGRGEMNNAHLRGGGGPPPQWPPRRFGGHCSDYEVQLAQKNAMVMHQRREQVALGHELGLPQEWTY